jgi:hypothetical protein
VRTLLAFLAIGALATTLGCNGPSKKLSNQHNSNQASTGRHTGDTTTGDEGTGNTGTGDRTRPGTGTTGNTGAGAGTTGTTGAEKAALMIAPDQMFTVQQGKKAPPEPLHLKEKATATTAGALKATVENNKGLKIQLSPLAANKDTVNVTVDATDAQPGTYTVDVSEGTNKAGTFQVTVKKK